MKLNISENTLDFLARYRKASVMRGRHSLYRLVCFGFNILFRPERSLYYPELIKVEITTDCNLSCIFCGAAVKGGHSRKGQHMHMDTMLAILKNTPMTRWIDLQGVGEPLSHPQFSEILKLLNSRGISCQFTTNGSLMTKNIVNEITNGNVHTITISLSSSSADKYRVLHGADCYDNVLNNIRFLVAERKGNGPKIRILAVAMSTNIDELTSLADVAKELQVDSLVVSAYKKIIENDPNEARLDDLSASIRALKVYAQSIGMPLEVEVPIVEVPSNLKGAGVSAVKCLWPWTSLAVNVHGDIMPCCYSMGNKIYSLGNLATENIYKIFNSSDYKKNRSSMNARTTKGLLCHYCNDYVG